MSFLECKISKKLTMKSKLSPLFGGLIGLIPQCGFSVIASDLYKKRHITKGALIAIFIACSDEAIPLIISRPDKISVLFPLITFKLLFAVIIGYIVDIIYRKNTKNINFHHENCEHEEVVHKGCCNHEIQHSHEKNRINDHLKHTLIHSLKILGFVFGVNIIFGYVVYFAGENRIYSFLDANEYIAPLFSSLIGLIPNCASSVILSELYFDAGLSFSAYFTGLCCNAGLGLVYLFKNKGLKENLNILFILWISSIFSGYIILIIEKLIF